MGITGGININLNPFSSRLEELLWVVVFLDFFTPFISKLFLMVIQLLHPAPGVTAVRVDPK